MEMRGVSALSSLFINVSNIISPYCYSIFKAEPYTDCYFKCTYCYGRWYRRDLGLKPNYQVLRILERVLRKTRKQNITLMPIRLSTLTEPFQPIEERYKISLKILKLSYKYKQPIIINSKGILAVKEPWITEIKKLSDEGLLIYQVSISTLNDKYLAILEPNAPHPLNRLEVASKLADIGVPVTIRLSPFIPEIVSDEIDRLIDVMVNIGAKQLIIESLRLPVNEIQSLYSKLNLKVPKLERYSISGNGLLRHDLNIRMQFYREIRKYLDRVNIKLSFCKEGIYNLQSAEDCCGIYMLRNGVRRVTLYEIYKYVRDKGEISISDLDLIYKYYYDRGYLDPSRLVGLPRYVRKPINYHHKRLTAILRDQLILSKVSPILRIENEKIRISN